MLVAGRRLIPHEGMTPGFAKDLRGELSAGVAVDAGRIDKEISRHILSNSKRCIRHDDPLRLFTPTSRLALSQS